MNTPSGLRRVTLAASMLAGLLAVQGCATVENPDPLESLNRRVFNFNEVVDDAVLKPVARGYKTITPEPVQDGVGNFIDNLKDMWSAINLLLQGRPADAAEEVLRVGINTTLGFAGFIDVASSMRLERHREDFGQTLGVWGYPSGAYLVLPLMGPSTVRDVIGLPGDSYFSPPSLFGEPRDANWARAIQITHVRARALGATDLLGDVALDKYAFVRDAYLQRRENLIYNGEPPEREDEPEDEAPAAAPPAASGATVWRGSVVVPHRLDGRLDVPAELPSWFTGVTFASRSEVVFEGQALAPRDRRQLSEKVVPQPAQPSPEELAGLRETLDLR